VLQEQAGLQLQLMRQQPPIRIGLPAQQVQQQQLQQLQQQQVDVWVGGTGSNYLALSTPPHARPPDSPAFAAALAQNRALHNQNYAQGVNGLQQEQNPRQRRLAG
jgi:hypothetical protein